MKYSGVYTINDTRVEVGDVVHLKVARTGDRIHLAILVAQDGDRYGFLSETLNPKWPVFFEVYQITNLTVVLPVEEALARSFSVALVQGQEIRILTSLHSYMNGKLIACYGQIGAILSENGECMVFRCTQLI